MSDYKAGIYFKSDSREVRKSEKDLGRLEKQSRKTEKAASSLGKTFGRALSAVSVGLIARQVIKNTIEQEKAISQLEATLKSTGRYTPQLSKQMQAYASSLQSVTTFGDEAILATLSQLTTFENLGGTVLPRVTEAALDFAVKMGVDAKQAAVQFGRALDDPINNLTLLRRQGIAFTKSEQELIKELVETNKLADAQAIILGRLEDKFGGSARAARDTFGGALKGVQNAFGDLLEADGDSLPGVVSALNELEDVLSSPEVKQGFQVLAKGALDLISVMAQLPGVVGYAKDEIKEFFGLVEWDDLDRRAEQIADLKKRADEFAELRDTGGVLGRFLWGGSAEKAQQELDAANHSLEQTRLLLNDLADEEVPVIDLSGLGAGGSDTSANVGEKRDSTAKFDTAGLDEWIETAKQGEDAGRNLAETLNALTAEMGGPSAQAGLQLAETMQMLNEQERQLNEAGILTLEREQQLASARALATQQYQQQIEAIESQLTPAQELIQQLQLEAEMIGLSNTEREKRLALQMAGADATEQEIQAISRLVESNNSSREAFEQMNEFRGIMVDGLVDAGMNFEDLGDVVDRTFERMRQAALRALAEKAIAAIFGGGGGFGGNDQGMFGSILGSVFGAGKAVGGSVYPGRIHPIAERGPELLNSGGKQYLIPGPNGGNVTPITNNTTNNRSDSVTVILPPAYQPETASQLADRVGREQRTEKARNG